MADRQFITLTVNGDRHRVPVAVQDTLVDVLRNRLGLMGTKRGCTSGACGVCTVQGDDGRAVLACLSLAVEWDGRALTTIEGVATPAGLHPVQQAFLEFGAVQCGACTPGLIMTAKALLDTNPNPDEADINEALAGALCRCTGHIKVKEAVRQAILRMAAATTEEPDGRTEG
ncbi:MAG: (2Fe-2S)-binding protein [Gammaproteobacteria bacterium]|nr:(2Fe-2S)-binding protein [Gammaproteobacteria bacterium]